MRFVPIKQPEQQADPVLHRTRHLLIRQLTADTNSIRAHLAEFGIVAPVGRRGVDALIAIVNDGRDDRIPDLVRTCLTALSIQAGALKEQSRILDRRLVLWHRSNETCKRLDAIPGVGPALATALVASVADPKAFRSGRDFSAWVGLVPKQNSSGGRERLGNITKAGDRYLRSLFCAELCASSSAKSLGHSCWDVSLFGWAAFLRPGLNLAKRCAQRRSTLAQGHRQGRREAALTAASTARSLGKPGRSCRLPQHLLFVLGQAIHVEIAHGFEPVLVQSAGVPLPRLCPLGKRLLASAVPGCCRPW